MHRIIQIAAAPLYVAWGVTNGVIKLWQHKRTIERHSGDILSPENAKVVRLWLERFFTALATGNANFDWLPAWLRGIVAWLLPKTLIDNQLGTFGQNVLKSDKMAGDDPTLYGDIRPQFTWRNPPKGMQL